MKTSEIIRDLCTKKGISIKRLESTLGFGNGSLAKGDRYLSDRLYEVAKYFDVPMEYLITGELPDASPSLILSLNEERLLSAYRTLNDEGQKKVADYIEDLGEKYKKDTPSTGMIAG